MKIATASWCAPCKTLKTRLESAGIKVEYKDMDVDPNFFAENGIRSVPTLITDDGESIFGASETGCYNRLVRWFVFVFLLFPSVAFGEPLSPEKYELFDFWLRCFPFAAIFLAFFLVR